MQSVFIHRRSDFRQLDDLVPVRLRIVPGQASPARAVLTRTVVGEGCDTAPPDRACVDAPRGRADHHAPFHSALAATGVAHLENHSMAVANCCAKSAESAPGAAHSRRAVYWLLVPVRPDVGLSAGLSAGHWAACAASLQAQSQEWDRLAVQNPLV